MILYLWACPQIGTESVATALDFGDDASNGLPVLLLKYNGVHECGLKTIPNSMATTFGDDVFNGLPNLRVHRLLHAGCEVDVW